MNRESFCPAYLTDGSKDDILGINKAKGFERMMQDLQFYHGSILGGLDRYLANAKSHVDGRNVAYFTTDRVYALVCCRSRSENFVTMGPAQNGKQHYFERFPNQLKILYQGREGFLYQPLSVETLKNTKGHTWESMVDVPVVQREHYSGYICRNSTGRELGRVMIHRYDEIDPKEQKMHANYMRDHLSDAVYWECRDFLYQHFSSLWD